MDTKELEKQIQKFKEQREELKGWLYGTIHKQYDTEETAEVVQEDVDRYFSDEWIEQFILSTLQQERAEWVDRIKFLKAQRSSNEQFDEGTYLDGLIEPNHEVQP